MIPCSYHSNHKQSYWGLMIEFGIALVIDPHIDLTFHAHPGGALCSYAFKSQATSTDPKSTPRTIRCAVHAHAAAIARMFMVWRCHISDLPLCAQDADGPGPPVATFFRGPAWTIVQLGANVPGNCVCPLVLPFRFQIVGGRIGRIHQPMRKPNSFISVRCDP